MYVLMDLEWVTNNRAFFSPTQIAAMRVNDVWEQQSIFYSRIRPRDSSFYDWKHMGYTGGTSFDFLHAPGIHQVLTNLEEWLEEDDVICIWAEDAKNILKSSYNLVLKQKVAQRIVIINEYVYPYLKEHGFKRGSAYRIANACGVATPGPKHHSESDVIAIQRALKAIGYSPKRFMDEPPKDTVEATDSTEPIEKANPWVAENAPYQYDVNAKLIHKKGCSEITADAELKGYKDLNTALGKQYAVCPICLAEEIKQANRERNQDIINRTEYHFVYADNSEVFHRRDCGLILNTRSVIRGSVYYRSCEETGRRPCKCCNPVPGKWLGPQKKKASKVQKTKAHASTHRSMSSAERTSLMRFEKAKEERYNKRPEAFTSETAKDDFYTLTQPRFAFWAGTGYGTFHLRNCKKLHGLSNLKGFSHYNDAIRAGHAPCKYCKPSKKNDIEFAVPITSRKRDHETIMDLIALCNAHDYPYEESTSPFIFRTPVGCWKINTEQAPYILYHINLTQTPDDDRYFHRQPRLFLSLTDTFEYIHRHDTQLQERINDPKETPSCQLASGQ